ncbi:MAG: electron transport complex subunit RsxC [Clostridiales bacterium]|nr:electron transport complex subunit RsxC [Clostridiales bacterium]
MILKAKKQASGGVMVPHHKNTKDLSAQRIPTPKTVVIPLLQNIGAPCEPIVKVGDQVFVGQKIGDSDKYISAPVHSSVSGTVKSIGEIKTASGLITKAIAIESDGNMTLFNDIHPPVVETVQDLCKAVRESGVVGLGGAGFPTHVKFNIPEDKKIDTLIINAAECEPYITVDYREAIDNSWDVLSGVYTISEILNIENVVIAVEDNKPQAIKILKTIAKKSDTQARKTSVMALKSKYPQGAEKMMVLSATGRTVPEGKLPSDVGCIVINIATVAFISRYLKTGKPLVSRSLTVDGSAVKEPKNVRVPIGTRIGDVIDFCGGFKYDAEKLILGGPMMGGAIYDLDAPVCKQNNAILAFDKSDIKKERPCIKCGKCVEACPMNLVPSFIKKACEQKDAARLKKLGLMVCMECGCCAYSCPSGIPLVQYMRLSKQILREEKK